ncbi:MAG TPA: aminoglycoside phosphotransferase family protein [Chloroflexaceae bacterium]|nr:aminoglycoside phosphotransferase family protein [Chloroflexaceae bacterium]
MQTSAGTPPAEVEVAPALVAGLLADQHPDLAGLSLAPVDAGWDNFIFRLGPALAVRLPRRAAAAPLIAHEQTWLPRLAGRLTLPAPVPLRVGAPGRGFPWGWSVVPWLSGAPADLREPDADQAPAFGAFLRALHGPAPADAPANPFRGVPLAARVPSAEERVGRLAGRTDLLTPGLLGLWREAVAAPLDAPPTWLHGDLHPRNILVEGGAISGVIDWGDLTAGDPATDLAAIWMLFGAPVARAAALAAYGPPSAATLLRARGWAILFGVMLLDTGLADHPRHAAIGARALRRVAASLEGGV